MAAMRRESPRFIPLSGECSLEWNGAVGALPEMICILSTSHGRTVGPTRAGCVWSRGAWSTALERRFRKDDRYLRIINETQGREEEPTRALMDRILGGLNETTYNNTISISQLKSATEDGMVGELKNYIANMNTTGNISLNITKATAFLKNQKRSLEANLVPGCIQGVYGAAGGDPGGGCGDLLPPV